VRFYAREGVATSHRFNDTLQVRDMSSISISASSHRSFDLHKVVSNKKSKQAVLFAVQGHR